MNSLVLAGIVKQFYLDFSMGTFDNRLKLQKIIYLLQASGVNLGFVYSLYLYGPYCPELTKMAYLVENFNDAEDIEPEEQDKKQIFLDFKSRINDHKNDKDWLEIASTIHLFNRLYSKQKKEDIIDMTFDKKGDKFTKEQITIVWEDIESWLLK
ncbi:hypothetical protein HZA98_04545 [Candidatus Woesearchaeota archaeon]|nr:hypothetical protein [Candidatus Woesearchaeota archaeon]